MNYKKIIDDYLYKIDEVNEKRLKNSNKQSELMQEEIELITQEIELVKALKIEMGYLPPKPE